MAKLLKATHVPNSRIVNLAHPRTLVPKYQRMRIPCQGRAYSRSIKTHDELSLSAERPTSGEFAHMHKCVIWTKVCQKVARRHGKLRTQRVFRENHLDRKNGILFASCLHLSRYKSSRHATSCRPLVRNRCDLECVAILSGRQIECAYYYSFVSFRL